MDARWAITAPWKIIIISRVWSYRPWLDDNTSFSTIKNHHSFISSAMAAQFYAFLTKQNGFLLRSAEHSTWIQTLVSSDKDLWHDLLCLELQHLTRICTSWILYVELHFHLRNENLCWMHEIVRLIRENLLLSRNFSLLPRELWSKLVHIHSLTIFAPL